MPPYHHVILKKDEVRRFKVYFYEQDINGKYYIEVQEGENNDTESDYAYVYFTLPYEAPLIDGNIYVFGALSDWSFNNSNKMIYDLEEKAYKLKMLLKQGYYNYKYVYVKDGENKADHTFIEGSHYETENKYSVYIYYHPINKRYDRLVGVGIGNSTIKNN